MTSRRPSFGVAVVGGERRKLLLALDVGADEEFVLRANLPTVLD